MDKKYHPSKFEQKWYSFWEEGGYFKPKDDSENDAFVVTLPPPNVTGSLHAGHAMYVVEDIIFSLKMWLKKIAGSVLCVKKREIMNLNIMVNWEKN